MKPSTLKSQMRFSCEKFRIWGIDLVYFVNVLLPGSRSAMDRVVECEESRIDEETREQLFGPRANVWNRFEEHKHLDEQLYTLLSKLITSGDARKIVDESIPGSGLDAWKRLNKKFDPPTCGESKHTIANNVQWIAASHRELPAEVRLTHM